MSVEAGASINYETSPPPSLMRRMLSVAGKRGGWAITDQVVVSAGNFITNILLLEGLERAHYGVFGLMLQIMLFLNSLHNALVVYPLSVKGAAKTAQEMKPLATLCIGLTLLLTLPLGAVMFGGTDYVGLPEMSWRLGAFAVLAMMFAQIQETVRRALMAQMRFRDAVPGDAISYFGQATAIYFIFKSGHGSLETAFGAMACTSALASIVQALQIGVARVQKSQWGDTVHKFWVLGRWVMLSNFTALVTSLGYHLTLRQFYGPSANAYIGALGTFTNLTNPLVFSVVGLIIPAVARAKAEQGVHHAKKTGLLYVAMGFVPLLIYYGTIFCFSVFSAKLILRSRFNEYPDIADFLKVYVVIGLIGYIANALIAVLNGMSMSRTNFIAQGVNVVATVLVGLPLTYAYGVQGQIYGGLFATMFLTSATVALFIRAK